MKALRLILCMLFLVTLASATQGTWLVYQSDTETVNGDGSLTITPTVGISGDDEGYCNIWSGFSGYEQAAVMLNGNAWQWSGTQPSGGVNYGGYSLDWAYTFPNVTVASGGTADLSYAAKVEGLCDWRSGLNFPNVYLSVFYSGEFVDGIAPGYSPAPCWIQGIINNPQCPSTWPYPYTTTPLGWHAADLDSQQVAQLLAVPTSETTFYFAPYHITEGSFFMGLNPGSNNYDGHYVEESSYAQGTNTCWWPGANFVQYPVVEGSYWTVGQNGSSHNQYGLDSIGFASDIVNEIQTQGLEHDIDFPCVVTIYQEMSYEIDANNFYAYAENVDTQTIGSTTVNVCRAGVCTGTIQF